MKPPSKETTMLKLEIWSGNAQILCIILTGKGVGRKEASGDDDVREGPCDTDHGPLWRTANG